MLRATEQRVSIKVLAGGIEASSVAGSAVKDSSQVRARLVACIWAGENVLGIKAGEEGVRLRFGGGDGDVVLILSMGDCEPHT